MCFAQVARAGFGTMCRSQVGKRLLVRVSRLASAARRGPRVRDQSDSACGPFGDRGDILLYSKAYIILSSAEVPHCEECKTPEAKPFPG